MALRLALAGFAVGNGLQVAFGRRSLSDWRGQAGALDFGLGERQDGRSATILSSVGPNRTGELSGMIRWLSATGSAMEGGTIASIDGHTVRAFRSWCGEDLNGGPGPTWRLSRSAGVDHIGERNPAATQLQPLWLRWRLLDGEMALPRLLGLMEALLDGDVGDGIVYSRLELLVGRTDRRGYTVGKARYRVGVSAADPSTASLVIRQVRPTLYRRLRVDLHGHLAPDDTYLVLDGSEPVDPLRHQQVLRIE